MAQMVKNLSAIQETQVRSLTQEDPLEKRMATHSSILAWRISIDRGAWWVTVHGVTKSHTEQLTHTHRAISQDEQPEPLSTSRTLFSIPSRNSILSQQ